MNKPQALSILRAEYGPEVKVYDGGWFAEPRRPRYGVILNGTPALGEHWRRVVAQARICWVKP